MTFSLFFIFATSSARKWTTFSSKFWLSAVWSLLLGYMRVSAVNHCQNLHLLNLHDQNIALRFYGVVGNHSTCLHTTPTVNWSAFNFSMLLSTGCRTWIITWCHFLIDCVDDLFERIVKQVIFGDGWAVIFDWIKIEWLWCLNV